MYTIIKRFPEYNKNKFNIYFCFKLITQKCELHNFKF